MSPGIHLHGLDLTADDALRLNVMALGECAEALDTANTFHGYEVAAGFLHSTMVDSIARFGLGVADLVRYTELCPDVVLDILGAGFQPFSPGGRI